MSRDSRPRPSIPKTSRQRSTPPKYREDKGPCLDAWREKRVVILPRIEEEAGQYPGFAAACLGHGVVSTMSVPMVSSERAIGAMNFYAKTHDAFSADDEKLGTALGHAAATVLVNASAYWTALDLSQNLEQAMRTRASIEQAKGMLMAGSPGMTPDEAFDLLRRASQRENVKLHQI